MMLYTLLILLTLQPAMGHFLRTCLAEVPRSSTLRLRTMLQKLLHPWRASWDTGCIACLRPDTPSAHSACSALLVQISDVIKEHPAFAPALDWSARPGTKTYPRWKDALIGCFKAGRYPHLVKTERKVGTPRFWSTLFPAWPQCGSSSTSHHRHSAWLLASCVHDEISALGVPCGGWQRPLCLVKYHGVPVSGCSSAWLPPQRHITRAGMRCSRCLRPVHQVMHACAADDAAR